MDRTPPEVWAKIASYACTDSGSTGCSLSLTSRFIRQACEPYTMQSIAVHGPRSIYALQAALLSQLAVPCRTRYLYISQHLLLGPSYDDRLTQSLEREAAEREHVWDDPPWQACTDDELESEKSVAEAIWMIIEIVASTVEVMGLDIPLRTFEWHSESILAMPRLTDLTCNKYPLHDIDGGRPHMHSPSFPLLFRLHITRSFDLYLHSNSISRLAPALRHLKFTGFSTETDGPFGLYLAFAMGHDIMGPRATMEEIGLLGPSIQTIYVKPRRAPARGARGDSVAFRAVVMHNSFMRPLVKLDELGDSRFVLLKADTKDEAQARDPMADWKAAIQGIEDYWAQEESPCFHVNDQCDR
ncbi:hypothetical protein HWV62_37392 [Athelia sp. TMB]|nr:hypothetical protein HWV62_37392 [Athelia sp. TMB]